MAMLSFDATGVEPAAPRDLLPPGKYPVHIVQSEMRPTRSGDGQMLWLEMDVIEGPFQGRKLWDQLNLVNRNEQTVEIAQRTLSAICHAVGQLHVTDSEQLHHLPMLAIVAVGPDSRDKHLAPVEQRKQNKVKGYAPLVTAAAATRPVAPRMAPSAPVAPAPRPASAASATPPWRRAG